MPLDITLPIAARMAGPAPFVILGLAITPLARGRRDRLALGVFLAGVGAAAVLSNLGLVGGGAWFSIGAPVACVIGALGGIASMPWPPDAERHGPRALAALAVLYLAHALPRVDPTAAQNPIGLAVQASGGDAAPSRSVIGNTSLVFALIATPVAWAPSGGLRNPTSKRGSPDDGRPRHVDPGHKRAPLDPPPAGDRRHRPATPALSFSHVLSNACPGAVHPRVGGAKAPVMFHSGE